MAETADYEQKAEQLELAERDAEAFQEKLAKIEQMCQRHNHPGVNTGAQTLAAAILRIIQER